MKASPLIETSEPTLPTSIDVNVNVNCAPEQAKQKAPDNKKERSFAF
jgi:hypothetical protein